MDIISKEKRSWVMSRIRGRDTKPEILVRSILHRMGYRFRLHRSDLPGRPDIVLPRHRTAVFVHGCFWHRHSGCRYAYEPKSRKRFWQKKFLQNIGRDRSVQRELELLGWHVVIVWECETRSAEQLSRRLKNSVVLLGKKPG